MASLGLPGVRIATAEVRRKGFRGRKSIFSIEPEHKHRHLHHIVDMINAGQLTPRAKDLATRIFTRLGEAEAKVHGVEIRKVHFHEVGAIDSIADIVGTAIGLDLLGIERVEASAVPTGWVYRNRPWSLQRAGSCDRGVVAGNSSGGQQRRSRINNSDRRRDSCGAGERFGPPPAMT